MAHIILAFGAGILLFLGIAHGIVTLLDAIKPRYFTPTDERLRLAMQGSGIAMMRGRGVVSLKRNLWRGWLGFNLSHSLGIVALGAALLVFAFRNFADFSDSMLIQCFAVVVTFAYLMISIRFWFWAPTVGFGIALVSIIASAIFA